MVSFQCDGCTDVVKKPKLDQHRVRCGASFTCIDCSKTFQTPVDWKGHTSCISEAEKYQKSLYKPKANGGGQESTYRNGSGKFQGRGGSWGRPPPRSQATGANGTPLGTPPRMSPVIAPPKQDEKNDATAVPEPAMEKEEPKKHKKRKSEVTNTTHVEPVNQSADDPISRKEPKDMIEKEGKNEKKEKRKKEKKEKDEKNIASNMGAKEVAPSSVLSSYPVAAGDESAAKPKKEKKDKKDKKEKKKAKHDSAIPPESTSNGVDPASASSLLPSDAAGEKSRHLKEKKNEKKKEKKKEKEKIETVETGDAPNQASAADIVVDGEGQKKKKKKTRKSEVANEAAEVNDEVDVASASSETTSKKRKREAEEQNVTGQEVTSEKKKKKTVAVS